jgi:signal transduction histidine kinase
MFEFIEIFKKYDLDDGNFMYLGEKEFRGNEENILEIFCKLKIEEGEESIDFLFNDVTRSRIDERKKAETKYKSTILSKIAHEFKNPLICISELLNQLKCLIKKFKYEDIEISQSKEIEIKLKNSFKDFSGNHLDQINKIIGSTQSMSNFLLVLIKDLDYFSLISSNKNIDFEKKETNLNEITQFCNDIAETLIKKYNKSKQLNFSVFISQDLPSNIITDEWRIKQILINLISNAIKFTICGEVKLKICLEEGKYFKFSVQDTGIGISEEKQNKLFKPFEMGSLGYINNDQGSGLGLSIVKDMTKKLGEEIQFLSKINMGSEFWFRIPFESLNVSEDNLVFNTSNNRKMLENQKSSQLYDMNSSNQSSITKNAELSFNKCNYPAYFDYFNSSLFKNIPTCKKTFTTKDILKLEDMEVSVDIKQLIFGNSKIFIIVDDEEITRKSCIRLIHDTFENLNFPFILIEADDGAECIFLVYRLISLGLKISLISSDQTMNYILGSTAADIISGMCKKTNIPKIPYVLLSAFNQFEHNDSVDKFISKPLTKNKINELLKLTKKDD